MKRMLLGLATLGMVASLVACSTSTEGTGTEVRTSSTKTTARTSVTPSPSITRASSATVSTVSRPPTTAVPPTTPFTAPPATPTTSAAVVGPAQVLNVTWLVTCASNTDPAGTVRLTWTTKGANQVYILAGQVASVLVGADPKTGGGKGPFAPNGSTTLAFQCADAYGYYLVEAYNTTDNTKSGVVQQVPR